MGSFFDSLKGAFGGVAKGLGTAADWSADVIADLASISGDVAGLVASTQAPDAVVLNATVPGISPTYLNPSSPPTVATSSGWNGTMLLVAALLVGAIVLLNKKL